VHSGTFLSINLIDELIVFPPPEILTAVTALLPRANAKSHLSAFSPVADLQQAWSLCANRTDSIARKARILYGT
jgi:hypothetical protein